MTRYTRGEQPILKTCLSAILLCLIATTAGAGELSDSVFFGNAKSEKAHRTSTGKTEVLATRVGTVDEKIPCRVSSNGFSLTLRKQPGQPCTIQIQEAYPPESPGVRYTYQVHANDKLAYIRDFPALMFGQTSYFVTLDDPESVK